MISTFNIWSSSINNRGIGKPNSHIELKSTAGVSVSLASLTSLVSVASVGVLVKKLEIPDDDNIDDVSVLGVSRIF